MSKALSKQEPKEAVKADAVESVLVMGDLSKLTEEQRVDYYMRTCASLDLNPLTRPFDYISLQGKLILYARKDATEQLRTKRGISVEIISTQSLEGVYVVTAKATEIKTGRVDSSVGAVNIQGLRGDALANALMKAETKAKRRVTLSICGLGMLDETELETIPGVAVVAAASTPAPLKLEGKAEPKTVDAEVIQEKKAEPEKEKAKQKEEDIPLGEPAPTKSALSPEEGQTMLKYFEDAMPSCQSEADVKSNWETFMKAKPSTAEAGKAWKIRAARLAVIRKGGAK